MAVNQCYTLRSSVGASSGPTLTLMNLPDDVRAVQTMLNEHAAEGGYQSLLVTGTLTHETVTAIRTFQQKILKMPMPTGRVDPGSPTLLALNQLPKGPTATSNLSGAAWWHANQKKNPNSELVDDLEANFRAKVKEFLAALQQAGASVSISSTKRDKGRAHLMHYAWEVAHGQIEARKVPAYPGIDIVWDHGNAAKSKAAAAQMVKLYDMAYPAALNTMHMPGLAIDMTITWTGTMKIKNKSGATISVGSPNNGNKNTTLHAVGATYGVIKLVKDPPHWSSNGQ